MPNAQRKRGRPPSIDVDQAQDAMVELFRAKGFAAASLDDLSEATGLSRPSLYRAFGDKLSMYLGALTAFERDAAETAGPALLETKGLGAALTAFFDEMLEIYYRDASIIPGCLVFGTAPTASEEQDVRHALAEGIERLDATMKARAQEDFPDASDTALQTVAQMASNTLIAFSARAKSGASKEELRVIGTQSANAIVAFLRNSN